MKAVIRPSKLYGNIPAPPSKSFAHRALICAAMCSSGCTVEGIATSQDVLATLDCLKALGKEVSLKDNTAVFSEGGLRGGEGAVLSCRESGSTLRFFIPIALALGGHFFFHGSETLLNRPLSVYEDICRASGISFIRHSDSLELNGKLSAGEYEIRADVSSQFVSGLMFGLCLIREKSVIRLIPPVSSKSYIDMTVSVMESFAPGAAVFDGNKIYIDGRRTYSRLNYKVEGDYSNAAFLDAFNYTGGDVNVNGLEPLSVQGDKVYRSYFDELKAGYCTLDIDACPDLGPVLFALAAALHGARFTGTKRLKIKESDRCLAMQEELSKFGISCVNGDDVFTVDPCVLSRPSVPMCGHNDHRIVMALSVLLTITGGEIEGAEAVSKSFPDFFDALRTLNADVELC